jgi:lipopolysaccharide export system permease protein
VTILQRYIAKTILASTGLVLLVLLGLYTFIDFISELEDIGKGKYQLGDVLSFLALSTPKRFYELLPVAALLGSVLGLGSLASQTELVVMRAAGISIEKISKAVMLVALALMCIALFVGEVIRPTAEQKAREIQSMAQTGTVGTRIENGFWTRDGRHFNHIARILPDGRLQGISIYKFDDDNRLLTVTKAEEASYEDEGWILSEVVQSSLDKGGVKVSTAKYTQWEFSLNPDMLDIVIVPPEFLPIWSLLEYIEYLDKNHQSVNHYQMAFWMKMMMPLSSAVMVFLAVPFVFGPLRSAPIGGRILVGALVGIGFHLFNQSFQNIGIVYGLAPWFSAALPTFLFAGLGYYGMRRIY